MDPDETPASLTQAYGLASKAGDTEAMNDLHGRLLKAYQKADAAQNNPTTDMSTGSRILAGAGHGMKRLAEGAGNLIGLVPDETLKDEDELSKPLMNTTAGKAGDILGQVAATYPLGRGTGALAKAAGPLLAQGGTYAPALFKAALAAGEGAGQGAAMADPDEQGNAALGGAVLGGALSGVGAAAGKVTRGLVGKSPAAQRLVQDADEEGKDLFIPISQGGTGPAKTIYQNVLPYALGVEHQLKGQSTKAKKVVEEIAAEQGMPAQANAAGSVAKVKAPVGETMEDTAAGMKGAYQDAAENTINSYAFKPQGFQQKVFDSLQDSGLPRAHRTAIAEHLNNVLGDFAEDNGEISGENLMRAKAAAGETLPKLAGSSGAKIASPEATQKALGAFDNVVQETIDEHKALANPTSKVAVEHEAGELGDHVVKSPNGEAHAQESGPYLQIHRIDVDPKVRGTGEGMAMMERMSQEAQSRGLQLASDVSVSPSAQKLYSAMKKRGFEVTKNPSQPGVAGNLVSQDPRVPVYTVGANKARQQAGDTVRDLENFQRLGQTKPEADAITNTSEANPAGRGALSFKKLAGEAPPDTGTRSLAQDAHEVLEKESPGGVNPAGRHFFHLAELGTGLLHPAIAPGMIGGNLAGNALATKTAQKGLYGDLAGQKLLARILRENPQAAYSAGLAGRSAVNASGQ